MGGREWRLRFPYILFCYDFILIIPPFKKKSLPHTGRGKSRLAVVHTENNTIIN